MVDKNFLRAFLAALLLIVLMAVSFFFGRLTKPVKDAPIAKSDTAYVVKDTFIHDTTYIPYPVPVAERQLDDSVSVPVQYECGYDTIIADAKIPRTQVEYEDSAYHAWVSGVEPRLDSIHLFDRTLVRTITKEITNTTYKKRRITHGIQGGVFLTPKGIQPGIGYGVTISF